MPGPDFSEATVRLLAARAAMICTNPECGTLTVGPDDAHGALALKLGEAAHICAARDGQARWVAAMTDAERAHPDNGIWLCANCHTIIDKNLGASYPKRTLLEWKHRHAAMVSSLLRTHRSPLPYLRKFTEEGAAAHRTMEVLEHHGALFEQIVYENPDHVEPSIRALRGELQAILGTVAIDSELKQTLRRLAGLCREYMNATSTHPAIWQQELSRLRAHVGVQAKVLRDRFGCPPGPGIATIIP